MDPDKVGYTEKVPARSDTVRLLFTATAMGRMSSDAVGATITPPMMVPEWRRQKSFTNPCRKERIFARGFVASGKTTTRAATSPDSTCAWVTPTAAISGRVNTAVATVFKRIGLTPSPNA